MPLAAFLPALLLLLFGAWAGTFPGGATFGGALVGQVALLGTVVYAAGRFVDPLRLGPLGRFLPIGLWLTVVASAALSPVPRAGLLGAVMLPALLCVPAAVERAWSDRRRAGWGLAGIAAVVILVSSWGVGDRFLRGGFAGGEARAAMPLGHHALFAGFLVAMLPLTILLSRRREGPPASRLFGAVASVLALVAIAASGSLLAAIAVVTQGVLFLLWHRRLHRLLLPSALLILGLQMPRVAAIFSGEDVSTRARLVYLDAGWRGLTARPWFGWGPGSTPWTIAEHLRPLAGVNPPSEMVGDLHSLPLQILYELGSVGFVFTLGTAAFFLRRRLSQRAEVADQGLLAAGLIGLLGAAVTRLGGASLSVTALPLTVGIAAGAALAAFARRESAPRAEGARSEGPGPSRPSRFAVLLATVYVLAAAYLLARPLRAQRHYEAAREESLAGRDELALSHLDRAVALDPRFPLYRARRAWIEGGNAGRREKETRAAEVTAAARDARSLSALWLDAGVRGLRVGEAGAIPALRRAAALDPLAASAPYWLALALEDAPGGVGGRVEAIGWAAQGLAAEPRLLAAAAWRERPVVLEEALRAIEKDERLDAGWRLALLAAARRAREAELFAADGEITLDLDAPGAAAESFSLYAFRRRPWPARLAPIRVDVDLAEEIRLPPAPPRRP